MELNQNKKINVANGNKAIRIKDIVDIFDISTRTAERHVSKARDYNGISKRGLMTFDDFEKYRKNKIN